MHGILFVYCVFDGDLLIHVFSTKKDALLYKKKHSYHYDKVIIRKYPLLEYYKKTD